MVAVFAALNVVCDSFMGIPQFAEGVWYSWIFVVEPLNGILLGPWAGFLSTLLGVIVGHFVYFRGVEEFLFTIGAPLGAMVSGLMLRDKGRWVLGYYAVLLFAYFTTPVAWQLPLWGMWDTYCAFIALSALTLTGRGRRLLESGSARRPWVLALYAFIGLEADVLFRIFLFIPCQTYRVLYGLPVEALQYIWYAGAVTTPVQVTISALVTAAAGPRLLRMVDLD